MVPERHQQKDFWWTHGHARQKKMMMMMMKGKINKEMEDANGSRLTLNVSPLPRCPPTITHMYKFELVADLMTYKETIESLALIFHLQTLSLI